MGVYTVSCSVCKEPFQWWSGNGNQYQVCHKCDIPTTASNSSQPLASADSSPAALSNPAAYPTERPEWTSKMAEMAGADVAPTDAKPVWNEAEEMDAFIDAALDDLFPGTKATPPTVKSRSDMKRRNALAGRPMDLDHSCHDECQKPGCVMRRERDEWQKKHAQLTFELDQSRQSHMRRIDELTKERDKLEAECTWLNSEVAKYILERDELKAELADRETVAYLLNANRVKELSEECDAYKSALQWYASHDAEMTSEYARAGLWKRAYSVLAKYEGSRKCTAKE